MWLLYILLPGLTFHPPAVFLLSLRILEQTAILVLYNIN